MATNNGRLRFDLELHANSKDAKKELQELGNMLNELAMKNLKLSLTQDIKEDIKQASKEVGEFSALLTKAVNTDTGKLDLSKLNTSLKAANTDINKVAQSFAALGNDGTMAFASVVKQINAAEVPLRKTNKLIDEMWVSLKNTMKWQISSSVIHGLQSGLSTAYSYAQDLNKSLNDIRIVTGYNTDKMAEFAVEANKAAKALSTTTTTYTNASLIYYQQGLTDQEVLDRTEVTVKMANAAGASAETVSDQLTAVWNNFYDGSKSLEYYADVMTALGAATASSTDEIAEGLEKFAAIADTVGLSYEYAASALATVTATTRQSADVVGTAFKTLFARIQDLELGNTLDDGTTLGTYSQALKTVGVDIKDASGEMKSMDTILDELGAKWDTLSQSTKVALAQTVAGTRQYSQLIALMDNWDYFQENLSVANTSSGTLDKQAEIYAESWEAAEKRVKASAQTLYTTIIDDEFFIKLTDTLGKIIDKVTNLINGLGGVKGLLATISTYVLTIGKTKISEELIRLTGPSQAKQVEMAKQQKMEANSALQTMIAGGKSTEEGKTIASTYNSIAKINNTILERSDELSDVQKEIANSYREQYEQLSNISIQKAKSLDQAREEAALLEKSLSRQGIIEQNVRSKQKKEKENLLDSISTGVNREGAEAFSADEITSLNGMLQKAGMNQLSEDDVKTLTMDATKLSGAAETSHLEKYQGILNQIAEKADELYATLQENSLIPSIEAELEQYKKLSELTQELSRFDTEDFSAKDSTFSYAALESRDKTTLDDAFRNTVNDGSWVLADDDGQELKNIDDVISHLKLLEEQAQETGKSAEDIKKINGEIGSLKVFLSDVGAEANKLAKTRIKENHLGIDPDTIDQATKAIDDCIDEEKDLEKTTKNLNKQGKDLEDTINGLPKNLPTWQEQLVTVAGATSAVISSLQNLSGIWDTLNNDDMSFMDKMMSIMSTMTIMLPSLIANMSKLKDVHLLSAAASGIAATNLGLQTSAMFINANATKLLNAENKEQTAQLIVQNAVKKGLIAQDQADTALKTILTGLTKAKTEADMKQLLSENLLTNAKQVDSAVEKKGLATKLLSVIQSKAQKKANNAETPSWLAKAAAMLTAEAAAAPLLVITLAIVAAIVALVVIITVAVALFKAFGKEEDADIARKKEAEERVTSLTEKYNELKTAVEDLKTAMSEYDDAVDALDDLTYGTDEYAEALEKANQEARDLIETYGLWDKFHYENGLIVFDDGVLEDLETTMTQSAEKANQALLAGQVQLASASATVSDKNSKLKLAERSNYFSYINSDYDMLNQVDNFLSYLKEKDENELYTEQDVKDAILAQTQDLYSDYENDVIEKEYQDRVKYFTNDMDDFVSALNTMTDELAESAKAVEYWSTQLASSYIEEEFSDKFIAAATDAEGNVNTALVTQQAQATEALTREYTEKLQDEIDNIDTSGISATYTLKNKLGSYSNDIIKTVFGDNAYSVDSAKDAIKNDRELALTYASILTGKSRDELVYESGNGKGSVQTLSGEEVFTDMNDAAMRKEIYRMLEEERIKQEYLKNNGALADKADAVSTIVSNRYGAMDKYGVDFSSAILSAISNGDNSFDFTSVFEEIDPNEIAELTGLDSQGILNLLGLDKKTIEDLGYSTEEFTGMFSDALTEWSYTLNTTDLEASTKTIQEAIKDLKTGSTISADAYTSLKEMGVDVNTYFTKMADGTYVLTGAAEEFLGIVNGAVADSWIDRIKEYESAKTYADNTILSSANTRTKNNLFTSNTLGTGAAAWDLAKTRVEYLNQMGAQNGNFGFSDEQLSLLNRNPDEGYSASELKELAEMMQAIANKGEELQGQMLLTADSLGTLKIYTDKLEESGIELSEGAYQNAVINIASQYSNCETELKLYQNAIKSGKKELVKHTENLLAAAMAAEELANAYGFDQTYLEQYAEELKNTGEYAEASDKALVNMASDQLRFDEAVTSSLENLDEWKEAVESATKSGHLNSEASAEMREAYGNLLDIDGSALSATFLQNADNLDLMKEALHGNEDAYNQLQKAARADIEDLYNVTAWQSNYVTTQLRLLNLDGLEIGANIDNETFKLKMQEIINTAGMTAETANAYLSSIGLDAEISTDDDGSLVITGLSKSQTGASKYSNTMAYEEFDYNTIDYTEFDDIVDVYKEIDDQLEDVFRSLDKASKAADRLYGADKIAKMEEYNKLLEKQKKLTEEKLAIAEKQVKLKADDFIVAGNDLGVSFQVDKNGNITNYEEVMTGLYERLHAMEEAANADGDVSDVEQKAIDELRDQIDAVTDALDDYDDAVKTTEDLTDELQDQLEEWQDNNFEILSLKIDTKLEFDEKELKWIDYQLGRIEDDFYSQVEGVGLLTSKMSSYQSMYDTIGAGIDELKAQYYAGDISQADFIAKMEAMQSAAMENDEALRDLADTLKGYYGNALDMALNKLDEQKQALEEVSTVLDHYSSLMSLMGEDENSEWMNQLLDTQEKHAANELAAAQSEYDMLVDQEAQWAQKLANTDVDDPAYESIKASWQAAHDAMVESQDKMLTKTEDWLQSVKDKVTQKLKDFGEIFEESLTGGTSFDDLTTQMERSNSLQEEYLTTTNQIYETNKLMRTAESEIAKSSSTVAKNKLKDFVNETKQMQEQGELSEYELEMQQAKYDLLLAEIALEEAQNSKSTVRLQRDANGNYGYVYTADENKVSAAQQAYEDADNAYYNKSLDGANNYAEKYISTMQEMYNEITEIMNDFTLTDEERDEKIRATKEYYYKKLGQYSDLYQVAITSDSRTIQEAWSTDFGYMITDTELLDSAVSDYLTNSTEAFKIWQEAVSKVKKDTNLNDTTTVLSGLAEKSDTVAASVSGLADELGTNLTNVIDELTKEGGAFDTLSTKLSNLSTDFKNLAEDAKKAITEISKTSNISVSPEEDGDGDGSEEDDGGSTELTGTGDVVAGADDGGSTELTGTGDVVAGADDNTGLVEGNNYTSGGGMATSKVYWSASIQGGGSFSGKIGSSINLGSELAGKFGSYTITSLTKTGGGGTVSGLTFTFGNTDGYVTVNLSAPANTSSTTGGGGGSGFDLGGSNNNRFHTTAIAFDTGGYTGEWGNSGKLAMLHEKELVLNKSQTQDLLSSMELLDRIIQMIDLQAANSQLAGSLSSPSYSGNTNGVLEQNVHIEASFPNATNHSEIEEAFKNLTNLASQYANRK